MKKLYVAVIFILFSQLRAIPVAAQKMVSGIVLDKANKLPIPGATVVVLGTRIGTSANLDGAFRLEVPQDTGRLVVSSLGYTSKVVAFRTGDSAVVRLKVSCHIDFFYRRYIGVSLYSGLLHTPLGAAADVFYPHLRNSGHFRPAIRLQAGYQARRTGQQRFASVGLNQLFVTCGYNLDAAYEYQAIRLIKNDLGFSRHSFMLKSNGLLWRGCSSLAVGKAEYQLGEQRHTSYGVEIGALHWVGRKSRITLREKLAWWGSCWQFQAGAEREFKYGVIGANVNKIGHYTELNLTLGVRWNY